MPVQNANQVGTGFQAWYESIPPITRVMGTAMVVGTLGARFGLLPPVWFALLPDRILWKFEVWRLVTNFFIFKLGINFLIRMLWVIQYGGNLERQTYQFEPADYLMVLVFCGALCVLSGVFMGIPLLGTPLIMSIIYVWSRNFPDQHIMLYGMVKIQSFYLPFAFLAISVLLGQDMTPDLMGIVIGHLYWYLHDVMPGQTGRRVVVTPDFLKRWLADAGLVGATPPAAQAAGAPTGFQAFRGSGRRLAD